MTNKRKQLIGLSQAIKPLVKAGMFSSVNEGLIVTYKNNEPEIKEFKTFTMWKKEGRQIKKGSTAFLIWGRKLKIKVKDSEEGEGFKFFPVCCLFADTQVN
jgi:hypothetical protein